MPHRVLWANNRSQLKILFFFIQARITLFDRESVFKLTFVFQARASVEDVRARLTKNDLDSNFQARLLIFGRFPLDPFFEINPGILWSGIDNAQRLMALNSA